MDLEEPLMSETESRKKGNTLFPVFIKLEKLNLLLVGGGNVALEKLGALLTNSPAAHIRLVAKEISAEVRDVLRTHDIPYEEREFRTADLGKTDLVVIAVRGTETSSAIYAACREKGILTNVADTPELCDFYLSSVVQKGNLKIAISTNGKSPTIAKRIKEVLNDSIPGEMESVLENMERIRGTLAGDFSAKVKQLNKITSNLTAKNTNSKLKKKRYVILTAIFTALILLIAGYLAGRSLPA